jgi:hypothetical protein
VALLVERVGCSAERKQGNQTRHTQLLPPTQPWLALVGAWSRAWLNKSEARGMHSVFYIIGVVVVVLAILSLIGVA